MTALGLWVQACDRPATAPDPAPATPPAPDVATAPPAPDAPATPAAPDVAPPTEPVRPTDFAPSTAEQDALLDAGKKAMDAGDTGAAIAAFEQLASSGPVSGARASGAVALADLYLERGETDKAEAVLVAIQPLAPPYAELAYVLGRAQKTAGKNEAAIFSYREALRLQPLLLQAHIEIGGMYGELGEPELAAKAFLEYEKAIYRYATILEDGAAHPTDKLKICDAFSFLPDDRAGEALVGALDDSDRDVRFAAAEALGEVGSKAAVPKLRELAAALEGDPLLSKAFTDAAAKIEANPDAPEPEPPTLDRLDTPPQAAQPDAGK